MANRPRRGSKVLPPICQDSTLDVGVAAGSRDVAGALRFWRPDALPVAAPAIALWFASPAIAFWLSRTAKPVPPRLSADDLAFLGMVAPAHLRFFETFIGPVDHYFRRTIFKRIRRKDRRTEPRRTNIGMSLLANLAAYDFGFIPLNDFIERTTQTLATLDKLQRHRGHFYNWYDTRTLEPLRPFYISTVDSGNLADICSRWPADWTNWPFKGSSAPPRFSRV